MSQLATGIFGAAAISLALGAVQLASGGNLSALAQALPPNEQAEALATSGAAINRTAKADRVVAVAGAAQTRTIALRLDGFADTSFLFRVPLANAARDPSPAPASLINSGDRRPTVACEPAVSVLTEIAKRLLPGRCVT